MKTNANSVQVFELRMWSKKYFRNNGLPQLDVNDTNIFKGHITDAKSKKKIFFKSVWELIAIIEKLYNEAEHNIH